jgi:hypothetical protein
MPIVPTELDGWLGKTLAVIGVATILYNAKNYTERAQMDSEVK